MRPSSLLLSLAVLVGAERAGAQPSDADVKAADALFQSAKAAMERGDLATACPRFAESQRLDPAAGTMLNLGECEARTGKLTAAIAHYQEARGMLPRGDFRVTFADQRIAELLKRTPRLVLHAPAAPEARVLRDGAEVPADALGKAIPVDPGAHVCVLRAPGHAETRVDIALLEGEERSVDLPLGAPLAKPQETPASPPPPPKRDGKTQQMVGLALGGVGALGVSIGAVFGLVAKSTYDSALAHCPSGPTSCDAEGTSGGTTAHGQATVSTVAFLAGAAFLGAGVAVYLSSPKATPKASVAPIAGPRSAGLGVTGAF
jgi:hypothetical protein